MKSFFKEAVRTLKTSGTVRPSSKYLIRACIKNINFEEAKTVLEFGTGDGCFTREIAARLRADAVLYSFEVNPSFFDYCNKQFAPLANVHILNHSAIDFDTILGEEGITQVDYVVSSLPLSLLKEDMVRNMLGKVTRYLRPGGLFIQYQYSPEKYFLLKKYFDKVEIELSVRNLPPAVVYKCSNKARVGQKADPHDPER